MILCVLRGHLLHPGPPGAGELGLSEGSAAREAEGVSCVNDRKSRCDREEDFWTSGCNN